jgi:hypothetical protein
MAKSKKKAGILGKLPKAVPSHGASPCRTSKRRPPKAPPSQRPTPKCNTQYARLQSMLHRQCAEIVARLLKASATGRRGATIKGLCLAPHVQHKAAVYAVVCETLRFYHILRQILEASNFCSCYPQVCAVLVHDPMRHSERFQHGQPNDAFTSLSPDNVMAQWHGICDSPPVARTVYEFLICSFQKLAAWCFCTTSCWDRV